MLFVYCVIIVALSLPVYVILAIDNVGLLSFFSWLFKRAATGENVDIRYWPDSNRRVLVEFDDLRVLISSGKSVSLEINDVSIPLSFVERVAMRVIVWRLFSMQRKADRAHVRSYVSTIILRETDKRDSGDR